MLPGGTTMFQEIGQPLLFGFARGELEDAKYGVPVVPLVLVSFCWPGMLPCPETAVLSDT